MIKQDGKVVEKVYKIGGMYGVALEKIVFWLGKAKEVAESKQQKAIIEKLIEFYQTGNLKTFDEYCVLWVQDTSSIIDFTNGFIEDYGDPLGYRGAWQSMVYVKDIETTRQYEAIAHEAAWFEKNSPIMEEHKKTDAKGVSFKIINAVTAGGDCSPIFPLGVNLPNADWIRATLGSKSVSLGNIAHAYDEAAKSSGVLEEFFTPEQVKLIKEHGNVSDKLHTGLHEVIGHGSGKIMPGVATPAETLKNYASALEEARADLVALYYVMDEHLVEVGLMKSLDVGKAEYNSYIVNGLMKQLARLKKGAIIEQAHMRDRQLLASWTYEKGKEENVIEKKTINNKTYFVINDYQKLRELFGQLLREVQRIKSEGDYEAGKELIENYAVQVDADIHDEVLERYANLNIAPYGGFINPILVPVMRDDDIIDVKIEYPEDFTEQMMFYAKKYRLLPTNN
jgi:dipeptidyl-peptidase-3